ncbi:hypothetical protein GCM10023340_38060 [Nocardioides marinquilinus]|uniref:DUF58 domain-containing protein n=1 Tax=Nocardioides marinquilinus TaxID=1210400 RepID=A0ABP9PZ36_9ACTN
MTAWTSLTARGKAVAGLGLALLVAGLAWRYLLVAGLGGCLVGLVVAELVAVLTSRPVSVDRRIDPRVVVRGDHCHGHLRVRGRRRRGLVRLDVADRVDSTLVPVALPDRVESDTAPAEVGYPVPTPRRGLVDVGPVQVRLAGLTAMAARSTESGGVDQVRVLPRHVPLAGMLGGRRRAVAGSDLSAEVGGTDLVGLHEYAMGDDLRRLHWATSARSGRLMVREDAEPSEAHVCVVLDDRAASYLGDEALFEEAVEMAAAVCHVAIDAGSPVRFHTGSDRSSVVVPGSADRRPRHEQQELDWLFAEIGLTGSLGRVELRGTNLDVAVAVTGPGADLREISLALGEASVRIVAVVDPAPLVGAHQEGGVLVLRGATSVSLSMLWDEAVVSAA